MAPKKNEKKAVPPGIKLKIAEFLGDVDAEAAAEVVRGSDYLTSFKCSVRDCHGQDVLELLGSPAGLKCVEMAMTAACSPAWKPTLPQETLAAAMGHFMQLMKLDVHPQVLPVIEKYKQKFETGIDSGLTLKLEENRQVLYLIVLPNTCWFKLGVHKLLKKVYRYSHRRDPPGSLPDGVDWQLDGLILKKWMYVDGVDPDVAVHRALRKCAGAVRAEMHV